MAQAIAQLEGVMIAPGISRNGRGYSKQCLTDAYERLRERITRSADPTSGIDPVSVYTSHGAAGDDASEKIVGRISSVTLGENGEIRYRASLAGSSLGRDVLALVDTEGDSLPYLRGVSIRGVWRGPVESGTLDGQPCEYSPDGLEVLGLDLTGQPGVPLAGISSVTRTPATPREAAMVPSRAVHESVEAHLTSVVTETAPAEKPVDVVYADHGYLADKAKRFPLDTRAHAVEAWAALTTTETARDYTAAQLKRARQRTVKALERHGVTVTTEGYMRTERAIQGAGVQEMWPNVDGDGGYCIALHIGPLRVEVASYAVDPHDLDRISRAAAGAAADALRAVMTDPDSLAVGVLPVEGGRPGFNDDETEEAMAENETAIEDERDTEEAAKKPMPAFIRDKIKKREGADDSDDEDDEDGDAPAKGKGKVPASFKAHQFKAKGDKASDDDAADDDEDDDEDPKAKKKAKGTKEAAVADNSTETVTLTAAQFAQLLEGVAEAKAPAAPAAEVVEESDEAMVARLVAEGIAAAAPQETREQRIARLVKEGVEQGLTALTQTHVERNGAPQRTGLVANAAAPTESASGLPADWPTKADGTQKAVYELTESERNQHATPMLADFVESELQRHRARRIGL